jgi:hypothetical protein
MFVCLLALTWSTESVLHGPYVKFGVKKIKSKQRNIRHLAAVFATCKSKKIIFIEMPHKNWHDQ